MWVQVECGALSKVMAAPKGNEFYKNVDPEKAGRPKMVITDEQIDTICEELTKGVPLTVICEMAGMPSYWTVWRRIKEDKDFSKLLAWAREGGTHTLADECLSIADDKSRDTKTLKNNRGEEYEVADTEWINRSRLRVETRLRLIGMWNRKDYGDKAQVDHKVEGEVKVKVRSITKRIIRPGDPIPLAITDVKSIDDADKQD